MHIAALTDVGRVRQNNEDAFFTAPVTGWPGAYLLLVADGVGGKDYGELASAIAVDTFTTLNNSGKLAAARDEAMADMVLSMAALRAHKAIAAHAHANPQCQGMACTLTLVVVQANSGYLLQVGDSRCYLFNGRLQQLSQDQTLAAVLLKQGRISAAEAAQHPDRNVLHQALGVEAINEPLQPVVSRFQWQSPDILLLCSDGLSDMLSDAELSAVLASSQASNLKSTARQLLQQALAAGGRDNITLILAQQDKQA